MKYILTPDELTSMLETAPSSENVRSFCMGLNKFGAKMGLNKPHVLAQYLAQMMHESMNFRYDREVWGPTPAQKRYEGRKDLGNTQEGDGSKFRGRTAIQITGRANARQFTQWVRKFLDKRAPNFEQQPDKMNTDLWEGVGPLWFWDTRNLTALADTGDLRGITHKINGGFNGLADRKRRYDRVALQLLGYAPNDIEGFQRATLLVADGVSGKNTRAMLHKKLVKLPPRGDAGKPIPAPISLAVGGVGALGAGLSINPEWWPVVVAGAVLVVAFLLYRKLKR